jgi:hypothetical protein
MRKAALGGCTGEPIVERKHRAPDLLGGEQYATVGKLELGFHPEGSKSLGRVGR